MCKATPPKAPPPPPPPPTNVDASVSRAREEEKNRRRMAMGRQSTILTGPGGLASSANTGSTSLGGGSY